MRVNPLDQISFHPGDLGYHGPMTRDLFLIGATGRLGGHVLEAALARGVSVTALVREPARLARAHPRLIVAEGDVRDAERLRALLPGHAAVVSALGTRRGHVPYEVLSEGMASLVAAMTATGLRRVVAVASAGILQADATTLRRDLPGYPEAFRRSSAAHLAAYERLRESALDWTIACPPELVEGLPDQALVIRRDRLPEGPKRVSMPALARWMLEAVADPETVGHRYGLINVP